MKHEINADRLAFYIDADKRAKYEDQDKMEAMAPSLEDLLEAGTRYVA